MAYFTVYKNNIFFSGANCRHNNKNSVNVDAYIMPVCFSSLTSFSQSLKDVDSSKYICCVTNACQLPCLSVCLSVCVFLMLDNCYSTYALLYGTSCNVTIHSLCLCFFSGIMRMTLCINQFWLIDWLIDWLYLAMHAMFIIKQIKQVRGI